MTSASDIRPAAAETDLVPLDEAVRRLADANDASALGALIGSRAGLDPARVAKLLTGEGEWPVALIARTAGLSCNAYSAILRFRHRLLRKKAGAPTVLLRAYPRLPRPNRTELGALLLVGLGEAAA